LHEQLEQVMCDIESLEVIRALALVPLALCATFSIAQTNPIVMASTTSTEQSGLFGYLLPEFKKASGIDIKVVAVGTGQAIDMGRRGDADVLFVHDQVAEEKVVAEGFVIKRFPVMYNDFVLIGPAADPAKAKGKDIVEALKKLSRQCQLRLARRQERHARRRASLLENRRH
jgi:tungstate transport system substrate-binding protein